MSLADLFIDITKGDAESFVEPTGYMCPHTFFCDNGNMASVIDIQGLLTLLDKHEFDNKLASLVDALAARLSVRGTELDFFFFGGDKESMRKVLQADVDKQKATSKRFNLGAEDILQERVDKILEYTSLEEAYIVIWTRPEVIDGKRRRSINAERSEELKSEAISTKDGINFNTPHQEYHMQHIAFVETVSISLSEEGILNTLMTCREVMVKNRKYNDPHGTPLDERCA